MEVGIGEVRDCLTCPAPLIPFADSLFSTLEKLESLVAIHVGNPYNEFFDARNHQVNLPETTHRIECLGGRNRCPGNGFLSRWLSSASRRSHPPRLRGTSPGTV